MKCYLCDSTSFNLIKKGVRDNNDISVLSCNNCDLVFLDSFNHIDENFYQNSNMHSTEVKISDWLKETEKDDNRRYLHLIKKMGKNSKQSSEEFKIDYLYSKFLSVLKNTNNEKENY